MSYTDINRYVNKYKNQGEIEEPLSLGRISSIKCTKNDGLRKFTI